jgi:hypothetical protein
MSYSEQYTSSETSDSGSSNPTTPEPATSIPLPHETPTEELPPPLQLVSSSVHHLSAFWKTLSAPHIPCELVETSRITRRRTLPRSKAEELSSGTTRSTAENLETEHNRSRRTRSRTLSLASNATPPPPSFKELDESQLERLNKPLYKPPGQWALLRDEPLEILAQQHIDCKLKHFTATPLFLFSNLACLQSEFLIKRVRPSQTSRIGEFEYLSKLCALVLY